MSDTANRRRIFFVTYGSGHVDIVSRLLPELGRAADLEFQVLALTTAAPALERRGYPHKRCIDYLPLEGYEHALKLGHRLAIKLWDPSSGLAFEESCAYLGVSMVDLIREVGTSNAAKLYKAEGRKSFNPVAFLTAVLKRERPHLVITTCHVRMERAATIAARRLGITSVRIEDLFGNSLISEDPVDRGQIKYPRSEWPDYVVVLNEAVRNRLCKVGFPAERVLPLGQPVFAEWEADFGHIPPEPRLKRWTDAGVPVITYATPARRDILQAQLSAFKKLARRRTDWHFCVKLHPSIGMQEFRQSYHLQLSNVSVLRDVDIVSVVKTSSVVVIFRSTVGLLCIFSGVPLILMDDTGEPEALPFGSSGMATLVDRYESLEDAIGKALVRRGVSQKRSMPRIFRNPANATTEIASFLATIVRHSSSRMR